MKRLKKLILGSLTVLGLAGGAGLLWFLARSDGFLAPNGDDYFWFLMRPEHFVLLEGEEIPEELTTEAWRADLDYLADELKRRFAHFDGAVDWEAFDAEVAALDGRLLELLRQETILGLMGVAALPGIGLGSTGIPLTQRPINWRVYPIHAWLFDDGVWITLAGAGAEAAFGAELLAVGGRPVADILKEAAPYLSADNAMGRKALVDAVFSSSGMLQALGAVGAGGVAELTLRKEGGDPYLLRVQPIDPASLEGVGWIQVIFGRVDGWSPADPRPRERPYSFEYGETDRLLYLQLDVARLQDAEAVVKFFERLGQFVDEHEIARFVVDLRANDGVYKTHLSSNHEGDMKLLEPLVDFISGHPRIDRRGVLYTLIGRRTRSAAVILAAALERRTKTFLAGEPTGSAPNFYGWAVALALPRSKVVVSVSTRYFEQGGPSDRRTAILPSSPRLSPPFTHADHFAGRDPVLAAVLAHQPAPIEVAPLDPRFAETLAGRYRFDPFRLLTIEKAGKRLQMTIRGARVFAVSELYPLGSGGAHGVEESFPVSSKTQAAVRSEGQPTARFATDIAGVFLRTNRASGAVTLDWRGVAVDLPRVAEDYRLPIDLLRNGELNEGIAAFRRWAARGLRPDAWTISPITTIGLRLVTEERTQEAIQLFRLQAEIYPEVDTPFGMLGILYRDSDYDRAVASYRKAIALAPAYQDTRRLLAALEAERGPP